MAKTNQNNIKEQKVVDNNSSLKFLWIGVLVLLGYLFIYNKLEAKTDEDENAPAQEEVDAPEFSMAGWFNLSYQDKVDDYLRNQSRIGNELLPLKNQIDYKLFKRLNMDDYIVNDNDYFLSAPCIYSYLGKNYVGDSVIYERIRKAKVLSDTLKAKGIDLVLAYAPTKEYAMPELIPHRYLKLKQPKNNYAEYVKMTKAFGINCLDLYPVMERIVNSGQYPAYPMHGTHWSYYSECIVADTLIKYIEHLRGTPIPHIVWDKVDASLEAHVRDGDGVGKAKLMEAHEARPLGYPQIGYAAVPGAQPVKVLGIGDSYYRGFTYLGVTQNAFDNGEYWYYNNSIVPDRPGKPEVWELDLKSEIEKNKVIIILYSSDNVRRYSDGFIEEAYEMYTNPKVYYAKVEKERPIKLAKKKIHQDKELLEELQSTAKEQNISLDSAIDVRARQMAQSK